MVISGCQEWRQKTVEGVGQRDIVDGRFRVFMERDISFDHLLTAAQR